MNRPSIDPPQFEDLDALLQDATFEPEPNESFDSSVLRQVKLDRSARTLKFWMPAIIGALIAGVAVLSAVEVVGFSPTRKPAKLTGQEAKAAPQLEIPDFRDPSGTVDVR